MSNDVVIARPYAKAAFEYAKSSDITSWLKAITLLGEVAADEKVMGILLDPISTSEARLAAVEKICEGYLTEHQKNFLAIMAENNRLYALPAVKTLFQAYYDEYQQTVEAEVLSAFSLSEIQKQSLTATLEQKLSSKVELIEKINPELIGGAVIRIGDRIIDGSIKGRLQRLANHLSLKESLCQ